jgi:hypothetical protein
VRDQVWRSLQLGFSLHNVALLRYVIYEQLGGVGLG